MRRDVKILQVYYSDIESFHCSTWIQVANSEPYSLVVKRTADVIQCLQMQVG